MKPKKDDWTMESLADQADEIRNRLNNFRQSLSRFFVEKKDIIDLMVVAAIAGEPLLLVGPPGTCKSDIVIKFKDALGLDDGDYFEYMLTRFTEPSEIIGPVDINKLKAGSYIRKVEGKIPTAKLVFLDEIFKSNSAILNILLTIINERKFYQDGIPTPVNLKILFAATNELPEQAELAALKDRFCLKVQSASVSDQHFSELIDSGLQGEVWKGLNQKPWKEDLLSLEDILKANRYLTYLFGKQHDGQNDRQIFFPPDVFNDFQRIIKTLMREDRIFISDRKIVKLYKLFRFRSWLFSGGSVTRSDLKLLMYLGESLQEIELLKEKIPCLLEL